MVAVRRVGRAEVGADIIEFDDLVPPAGSDEVVVLVHGSGGNRATWWPVVPHLVDAGWRVVNLDVRGSGRSTDSDRLLGPRQVTVDLEAVRAAVGVLRWHVVGHSLGGWHALRYAVEHPEATASVSCVSSLGGVMTPSAVEWFTEFARMAATWAASDDPFASASLGSHWTSSHPGETYLYQLLRDLNPPPVRGVPGEDVAANALTESELGVLRRLSSNVPGVRFITGEADPYAPPAVVRSCADDVGAQFVEVPGAGHTLFWEKPEALVGAITGR